MSGEEEVGCIWKSSSQLGHILWSVLLIAHCLDFENKNS